MSHAGRPHFLNDAKRKVACAILAKGGTLAEAADCLDCHVRTLQREQRRNPRFRQQVCEAKAEAMLTPFQIIRKAARTNWRAASWMIAREDAKRCDRNSRVSVDDFAERSLSEAPSLRERLHSAAHERPRGFLEMSPEFEAACPKLAARVRELRARNNATQAAKNESETSENSNES